MPEAVEPAAVNTGPLIALQACGQAALLSRLHSPVVAPEAVELARGGDLAAARASLPWLEVLPLRTPPGPLLTEYLDACEAAVIALAMERAIPLVVIDERRGRMVARAHGLRVTGSVGVLLRGRRLGLVGALGPCLAAMRAQGVWLSAALCAAALREAGED